ncbi:MAG: hypothetical protein JXR86_10650 [Spirochaetales bacterium]|nr:hypothetical protein [Spirochaetales bacterium]
MPDFCNPEISLEVLSRMDPAELDRVIQSDKYIVINGTISSITEIERSESNLILDLHLVNGKWIGLETVENYSCIVNINGIEWEQNFPKRVPRVIDDEIFVQNSRILVIGKVSSYVMEQGKLKAVVDGEYIRKIQ